MNNEIRIRKRRFMAAMLTLLLLLNQFPSISADAAEYAAEDLVYDQILTPGDKILNHSDMSCVITYYDYEENGSELFSGTVDQNTPHEVPAYTGSVPDGFDFTGWKVLYVGIASGGVVESITLEATVEIDGTEITDSLYDTTLNPGTVIYSQWAAYTLTYYDENGDPLGASQAISANTPYTVNGYTGTAPVESQFTGWKVSYVYASGGEGSINLTAQFARNQYTITFDTNGGSAVAAITADYGAAVTAPADPTKTGYTFAGWDKEIPDTMPAENVTITARWTANKYTIEFVNEDGTPLHSSEVAYGEMPVYSGETPTKAATAEHSYTFAGWTPEIAAVTGDAIYTAAYTEVANQYTITFDTAGGSSVAPITQAYGTAVRAPDNPTRTGYSFVNWNPEIPATMPAEDITLLARWTANEYTISFNTDGGSHVDAITQDYGTAVAAPTDPTREGYTFTGWEPEIPAAMPAENLTITAQWTANRYSIRYILSGGTNGENPESYAYGTGVSGFADAAKPGYNFVGWYENAGFSGDPVTSVAADRTGDITLYAKFEMGTIAAGTYFLTEGVAYKLGNVTKVSGDNSVYTAGSSYYVPVSGPYTFS